MRFIRVHLESDEEESLRFRASRPLTRGNQHSVDTGSVLGSDSIPSSSGGSAIEDFQLSYALWRESSLSRSITKNSATYSLRSVRKFSSSYHSAGLFDDCRHAFLNSDSEISVYRLGDLSTTTTSPGFSTVLTRQYKHGEFIRNIASSQAFVIVGTNRRLLVLKIDADTLVDTISHGDWDPSGLACHESETHLVVFLGQCQRNNTKRYNGQIRVYRYRIDGQFQKLPVFALNVPANDCPKRFSFDAGSKILACITRIQNKVLVWSLDAEFLSSLEPFEFLKYKYTAVSAQSPTRPADRLLKSVSQETRETGVTSATVYQSPSKRHYVLCTTAPSTERWHHDGEWSFIILIPPNASRLNTDPGSRWHTFEQFKSHTSLVAGCPSSQHHLFAVLEDSGRLSVLRLDKHDHGGIHSRDQDAEILAHSLCKQDRPLTNCIRFDPSGSRLFAVDPKGKIVVTEFEKG